MNNYVIAEKENIYPEAYKKLVELNLVDFDVWYLLNSEAATQRFLGLQNRYPNRKLLPFARRDDCDDIACFEMNKGNRVQIIHDFAKSGWEQKEELNSFWDWVEKAIQDMIEFNKEEGIE